MGKTITIDPITRLEGHGKVSIFLDDAGEVERGILICGSGNGVCMTANKHDGVRAALCWKREIAELARQHNDANSICIPARFVSKKMAVDMVKIFVATEFEGGRHQRRVDKIPVNPDQNC